MKLINDIIKSKGKNDIDLMSFGAYLLQLNKNGKVDFKDYNVLLNDNFLPEMLEYENNGVKVSVAMCYNDVSIKIPFSYNLLTMSIKDIKKLLRIDNIGDFIK